MPRMDGTGPERKGPVSGRGMGRCRKKAGEEDTGKTGRGQGKRRQAGGGQGSGKGRQGDSGSTRS